MKKYLFNGAMALIVGGFIVSCSHDDISQTATVDQMTKSFDEMFTELYGPIAPNHNWGFETVAAEEGEDEATETEAAGTRALTRAGGVGEVIKPDNGKDGIFEFTNDEKNATGWRSPEGVSKYVAPITDAERDWVQAWFDNPNNRGLSEEGREFHNFYVQQVHNKLYSDAKDNKNGYFWQMNNGVEEHTNKTYKVKMDQLRIGSARDEASTVHINDFNATDKGGNAWNAIYVKNGSSKQFAYWASYGSQWQWKFRCVELEVPASCFPDNKPHKGWYVGLSYYCDKIEVAGQKGERIGEDEIDICNDWILKIVPGEGETIDAKQETTTTITRKYKKIVDLGRVFCEDIATAAMKVTDDVDYNDIVFDARVWEVYDQDETTINGIKTTSAEKNIKYQYDICMLAAGGTIPETVGVNNVDVHDAFGVGLTFMVNTWTENSKAFGQYNTPTNVMKPKDEVIYYTLDKNDTRLDKNNVGIKSIPIKVLYKNGYQSASVALENGIEEESVDENGEKVFKSKAPYKICVPIGTLWPIERVNIRDAYTAFGDYVKDSSKKFYENSSTQVGINLYEKAPTSKIQSDFNKGLVKGTTVLVSESSSSSTVDVVWEGNVSSDGTAITLYKFDFKQGQKLRFFGSGTIRVVGNNNQAIFESIPMSNGYCDINIDTNGKAANLKGGSIIINGSNFSLTKIVVF